MKKLFSLFCMMVAVSITAHAHYSDAHDGDEKAQEVQKYAIDDYDEPRVGTTPDAAAWGQLTDGLHATWANRNELYSLHAVPRLVETQTADITAWLGERANIEALLFSKSDQGRLSLRMTPWRKGEVQTEIQGGSARFMNYVITDDYKFCGGHDMSLMPWLAPDIIDQDKPHAVPAMETRPVWCSIRVPRDAEAGDYTTSMEVLNEAGIVVATLNLTIHVDAHTLPTAHDQKFHLDLWQQPYAVSRYYGVERWSDGHIEALRPYLQALSEAGQKVVSTIMFYEPWGDQSHDKFSPMIQCTLKADGTWTYDYTIFDRYVELCAEYGIDKQINCYSMVPWDMTFRYYDEAKGDYVDLKTTTSTDEYKSLWQNFLSAFRTHLEAKGWFQKTCIAMDERAEADMLNAYAIAHAAGFKMALAGNYHSSLNDKLQDFCVALNQVQLFTPAERQYRKANNLVTTVYTSCADVEPNIYSNSLPAESAYLPLHAAANDLSGYLHWSWINWDEHPLTDSRYRLFGSGDTYSYYPGNRSSVRFERLVEGIQQYEKIQILREEYKDNAEKLRALETLLSDFSGYAVAGVDCAERVDKMEDFLNGKEVYVPVPTDVTSGYYRIVSKASSRDEHIYNDALHSGNGTRQFTLMSNTPVTTNNGVWKVDVRSATKLALHNGDGHAMVAGASNQFGKLGCFTELTIDTTIDAGGHRYYYFTEAPNCTNGSAAWKIGGKGYITTWTSGDKTADDLLWRFEPVPTEGKYIYNVKVIGNARAYVTYTHDTVTETAFDGGFFISDHPIKPAMLSACILGSVVKRANIKVKGTTIIVSKVDAIETATPKTLFSTAAGSIDTPPYRIPGITCGKNGRLIATAARLVCGTDPGYGQVDVVCKTSDDNGKTWSDEIEVAVGTGKTSATQNYFDTAFGDPAVVADRESSEVLVMAVAGCTVYANGNTTRQNPNLIAAIHSLDGGRTWQNPVDETEQIYSLFDEGNPMDAAFVGGGRVFQSRVIRVGQYYRLYAALAARPNGNRVIYSDDFGRTWKALGGASSTPVPDGDEPKCDELPDGRVVITSRVGGGRYYNIYTYSNAADGAGQWQSQTFCDFADTGHTPSTNATNGELLIVPARRTSDGKSVHVALQSVPLGNGRSDVGIYYKELSQADDMKDVSLFCKGWDGYYQVSQTASAYSSLELQSDGRIAIFYEETLTRWGAKPNPVSTTFPTGSGQHNFDGYENIYLPLPLELITAGRYSVKHRMCR